MKKFISTVTAAAVCAAMLSAQAFAADIPEDSSIGAENTEEVVVMLERSSGRENPPSWGIVDENPPTMGAGDENPPTMGAGDENPPTGSTGSSVAGTAALAACVLGFRFFNRKKEQ